MGNQETTRKIKEDLYSVGINTVVAIYITPETNHKLMSENMTGRCDFYGGKICGCKVYVVSSHFNDATHPDWRIVRG